MLFRRNKVAKVLMEDLEQLKKDRDNLLEDLKTKYPNSQDTDFIVKAILTENAVIDELEHIINKAIKLKESK